MPQYRRQQVVEIMRHTAGKLTYGLHFLALNELLFQRLLFCRIAEHRKDRGAAIKVQQSQRNLKKYLAFAIFADGELGSGRGAPSITSVSCS